MGQLATIDDLLQSPNEDHGNHQRRDRPPAHDAAAARACSSCAREELGPFNRRGGPDGWWILTGVSVAYERHECPSHDLAGWRKWKLPALRRGTDRICPRSGSARSSRWPTSARTPISCRCCCNAIGSPTCWLIWPEQRKLVALGLDGGTYRVVATLGSQGGARIPPVRGGDPGPKAASWTACPAARERGRQTVRSSSSVGARVGRFKRSASTAAA